MFHYRYLSAFFCHNAIKCHLHLQSFPFPFGLLHSHSIPPVIFLCIRKILISFSALTCNLIAIFEMHVVFQVFKESNLKLVGITMSSNKGDIGSSWILDTLRFHEKCGNLI